ncbi:metal ABC transporter substrate-binding protein [Carboxylicivirga marina]|uniref:Zinc ABC transporter substrate-binding protein n=1 Tax=Carboxylicivirga marina TaxID=2800988 RepID=A0ABS1HJF6_9BACT|nr:metal ABC transporter substrate-binding protein [Carboxylicivirga marina]MBK3517806.1 zinc ABC transporter substrate-binding protein [Carboxylicivirga marina]
MKNLLLVLLACSFFACNVKKENKQSEQPSKPVVSVVNYPLYYFTERIGGAYIDLKYPISEGVDPAYWMPDSESLSILQRSDVLFTNGANYAKWLSNVSLPERIKFNTTEAVKDRYIEVQEGTAHSHGEGEEHVHTGLAFTTWLDLSIAVKQADAIKDKLIELVPNKKAELISNHKQLVAELSKLDMKLKSISSEKVIIGSHPVYQYLASAYQLHIHSVHFEPDMMPSHKQWHELEHLLHHHPSGLMIWEGEPSDEIKDELKKRNIDVLVFDPCGNVPSEGDFLSVMQANANSLNAKLN